jgi:hypothetical protein
MNFEAGAATVAVASLCISMFSIMQKTIYNLTPPTMDGHGEVSSPVTPGENVLVAWTVTKRENCPGEYARVWEGHGGFSMSEELRPVYGPASFLPVVNRVQTQVPEKLPPGVATLTIRGYLLCKGREREDFTLGPVELEVAG